MTSIAAPSRQRALPWGKTAQLAWQNIRLRFGRSLLVTGGIVLAIAFLTSIQTHETILASLRGWVATAPPSERVVAQQVEAKLQSRGVAVSSDAVASKRLQSRWLISLALLVAFVGVLNAMLMSVTERFREIGTMKCLGALDSFIVKLFLIESLLHGFVGSTIGAALGLFVTLVSVTMTYGATTLHHIPWPHLAADGTSACLIGITLTVLGALYPAWQAARMQPVEAMRSEL